MTFKPVHNPDHLHFVTATILRWRHLFTQPVYARIVLDALDWHRRQGRWSLYAYVLMPNHLHAILKPAADRTISQVLQSFGSFTAHAILQQLREDNYRSLLEFFAQRPDHDARKQHQIWQPIQAKNIWSEAFLRQKLAYIHNNPTTERWTLVEDRADYVYSSACFYDRGELPGVEVDDVWV